MASTFNAEQFLQARSKGQLDTKYPTCPAGEYQAAISSLAAREQEIKKEGSPRKGEVATVMDVVWEVLDEDIRELLDIEKVLVRQSVFLDFTEEGQLDYGTAKNVQLGRLREAVGQNDPSRDWFPNMLIGALGKITVEHTPNEKDPESPYANVTKVAPVR